MGEREVGDMPKGKAGVTGAQAKMAYRGPDGLE